MNIYALQLIKYQTINTHIRIYIISIERNIIAYYKYEKPYPRNHTYTTREPSRIGHHHFIRTDLTLARWTVRSTASTHSAQYLMCDYVIDSKGISSYIYKSS